MMKAYLIPTIVVFFFLDTAALTAQTKEEIYRSNIVSYFGSGDSPRNTNFYWTVIGRQIKNGQALAELPEEVKAMVGEILRPVHETHARRFDFEKGSTEIQSIDAEVRRLEAQAANSLFDLLGPELLTKASESYAHDQLSSVIEQRGFEGLVKLVERGLDRPNGVRLSPVCKKNLLDVLDRYKTKQKELEADYVDKLRSITQELWPRLMKVLAPKQIAEADRVLGKHAEWFRFIELPRQFLVRPDVTGSGLVGEKVKEKYGFNIMKLLDISNQEFIESGFEPIDPLIYELATSGFIADELDLTSNQREKLVELRKEHWYKNAVVINRQPDTRFELLLEKENSDLLPNGLTGILIGHQQRSLLQIELQLRTGIEYSTTAGLTHPRLIKHLELSSVQVQDLEKIGQEYASECSPIFDEYKQVRQKMHAEFVAAVIAIIRD